MLVVLAVLLLSFVSFTRDVPIAALVTAGILVAAAGFRHDPHSLHLAVFTAALIAIRFLFPSLRPWPYTLLVPLLVIFGVGAIVPRLRTSFPLLRRGVMGKDAVIGIAVTAVVSGVALFIWVLALKPDLSRHLNNLPIMPIWLLPLAGLAFAAGNAAMEEFIYRGVIMQALDGAAGAGLLSIFVQAWLFGCVHFLHGFPNGWWGVAMTFCYGVMLGWLRRRTHGMLAPWLAHVFADLVIFVIVAGVMIRTVKP